MKRGRLRRLTPAPSPEFLALLAIDDAVRAALPCEQHGESLAVRAARVLRTPSLRGTRTERVALALIDAEGDLPWERMRAAAEEALR